MKKREINFSETYHKTYIHERGIFMKKKTKGMFSAMAAAVTAVALFGSTAMAATVSNRDNPINVLSGNGGVYLKGQQTGYEIVIDLPKSEFQRQFTDVRINGGSDSADFTIISNTMLTLDDTSVQMITDERDAAEAKAAEEARRVAEEEARKIAESQHQESATTTEAPATTTEAPAATTEAPGRTTEAPGRTTQAPGPAPSQGSLQASADPWDTTSAKSEVPSAFCSVVGSNSMMGVSALQAVVAFFAPVEVSAEEDKIDITISSEYLDTLADGVYTIALRFTSGTAVTVVTVTSDASAVAGDAAGTAVDTVADASPATGDNTNMILYIAVAACSAGVLVFLGKKKKA